MSYTVFALKWRPKNFSEIVGQDHIVTTLKSAIEKGRLGHAYLFAGPRGVGKTSAARILAKAINCKEGLAMEPCSKCSSCLQISESRSLDVIEIDGASNRGIDEIRVLRENVKFAPVSGKFKVYIIDEVHQITADGFNALLKTLEEPPPYVKFIFATTHPHKVIPTILSRCQRLDFRRISAMEISAQLEKIAKAENISIDKEVIFTIAKSSDGSMRDAESVLDQLFSFSQGKISIKDVVSVLGLVEQETLFAITDTLIRKDPKAALSLLDNIIDGGKDTAVFLNNLIEHFRNLMVAKVTRGDEKLIDLPADICERLVRQSEAFTLEEIVGAFNILANTQEMAKRLESMRIPLEINLVRLAHDKKGAATNIASTPVKEAPPVAKAHPSEQLRITPVEQSRSAPAEQPRITPVEAPQAISLDEIRISWKNIIDNLGKVKMSVATYLNEGEPLTVQGELLTVALPRSCSLHKESLEKRENKALIEKILFEVVRVPVRTQFILSDDVKSNNDHESSAFIKSALDAFNGRVIKEG
ncbi:MAG: DNA polymerase III subunit gamma/tau [Candidatus Omnitrophica bacterium]|nr:DNA polymerase III subunit gamma/tau [Candidatus Omnitrophota bacterium]